LGIINFTDDIITIGKDLRQAIKDIFEKFNFHKLSYCVVVGNPIEKAYDKLTPKYGGRIVGVERQHTKLFDNKYYDVKRYEILREDYINAKKNYK
jgi:RimJ/RimL family protein N-acetyltransferase